MVSSSKRIGRKPLKLVMLSSSLAEITSTSDRRGRVLGRYPQIDGEEAGLSGTVQTRHPQGPCRKRVYGPLAQLVEHAAVNRRVVCSSHTRASTIQLVSLFIGTSFLSPHARWLISYWYCGLVVG